MIELASQHPGILAAVIIVCILVAGAILIGAIMLGRSIKLDIMGVHAELKPNGGSSVRDAIDRIEIRVAALEQASPPVQTTVVVASPPSPAEG